MTAAGLVSHVGTGQGIPVLTHAGEEVQGRRAEEKIMFL